MLLGTPSESISSVSCVPPQRNKPSSKSESLQAGPQVLLERLPSHLPSAPHLLGWVRPSSGHLARQIWPSEVQATEPVLLSKLEQGGCRHVGILLQVRSAWQVIQALLASDGP